MAEFDLFRDIAKRIVDTGVGQPMTESVLEERFWEWIRRTEKGFAGSKSQMEIGPFRVDTIFDCEGQAVVVELDGGKFHLDKEADQRRDAYLTQFVSAVIRIPFGAMWRHPQATFTVLGKLYPRFRVPMKTKVESYRTTTMDVAKAAERGLNIPIYDLGHDSARVGNAELFANGRPYTITVRRGDTQPGIVNQIYG